MSENHAGDRPETPEHDTSFEGGGAAEASGAEHTAGDSVGAETDHEPVVVQHAPVEVALVRSVRYGRIIVGGAALGAVIAAVSSLFFPVVEGANYELGQVFGAALVFGGAIGLALGGLLALLLGIVARRSRGAAIAVQTDVR